MATAHLRTSHRCSAENRRQQILDTATDLFARQGFGNTTTRQIAQRAQVNEALIFRHFASKEDLYWAVLEHQCVEGGDGRKIMAEELSRSVSPQENFAGIARSFLRMREQDSNLGRLLLFSALEHHQLSQRFFQAHIAEFYEKLAQHIREQIGAGAFREVDPLLAARGFWGMVVYHFLVQELFGGKQYQDINIDEASRAIADIWLNGMLPRSEAEPPHSSHGNGKGRSSKVRTGSERAERTDSERSRKAPACGVVKKAERTAK
jgi:AcrR family transcriptional regulator